MNKYCCFFCPAKDYSLKSLEDTCPSCGRAFGAVLTKPPTAIREYAITRTLGRGFYGAAYVAERGSFTKRHVVKISPVDFYQFFQKQPFEDETALHHRLAQQAQHVVQIEDRFDEDVQFADGSILTCHVTVLEYIEGELLHEYTEGDAQLSSAAVCQIAIDLLRIRGEFVRHQLNHNDLHDENLIVEKIRPEATRVNAIDGSIRVKAIDLGSIADDSKSSDLRVGDLRFIATHVDKLLARLLSRPADVPDRDYRIALALQEVVNGLTVNAQNAREPNTEDLVRKIEEAFQRATRHWRPWNETLLLKGFGDHYNAQTLESWNVPRLLVDPDNRWIAEVSKPGPQIVTGMRGCGKTMLLRALDFHARAVAHDGQLADDVLEGIRKDRFVGLFVSAQRLLDIRQAMFTLQHRVTRLFVHYALQAARALLHLNDIAPDDLVHGAHRILGDAVSDYLSGADELRSVVNMRDIEARIERIAVRVTRGDQAYAVTEAPVQVFSHLAEQFRRCASVFEHATVLYLLDDVSTRYLELERVAELVSALLFQNPSCAFKFTSEWQTIELGLQSPGRNHPIRVDRDVAVFDLGADVYQTILSDRAKGNQFVARVLEQRSQFHTSHPHGLDPKDLLGDVSLEQVAKEIAASRATSAERKRVYRGLSCLSSVCVGDIGDVIKLYDDILKRTADAGGNSAVPIPDAIQSDCFLALSSRRIYDLDRRKGLFKNHALAFADAAHELLVRSFKSTNGKRLRQYSSIYVRVSSDDEATVKHQIDALRDLIDAGVFVYSGGAARTKTKDSNPTQQFKLSYRKIYGLAAFIGLSGRDRFELSGAHLQEWLDNPSKEALIDRESQEAEEAGADDMVEGEPELADQLGQTPQPSAIPFQTRLFSKPAIPDAAEDHPIASPLGIDIEILSPASLKGLGVAGVLLGLGFEERALAASQLLSQHLNGIPVTAIRYKLKGYAEEIKDHWRSTGSSVTEVEDVRALVAQPSVEGLALVDISGLSKPLIFNTVRRELIEKGRVFIAHVGAIQHYPLQKDLESVLAAEGSQAPLALLERLAHVLKGETGPYHEMRLLDGAGDTSRNRAMIAFASAKHERLFSLLDKREYDFIEVIAPVGVEPRAKVARFAADFLCQNYQNAKVSQVDTSDLVTLLRYLDREYLDLYERGGANLELGLTGSKSQAVACAILSAKRKVAQAWYLSPDAFDEQRFSKGVGTSRIWDVKLST